MSTEQAMSDEQQMAMHAPDRLMVAAGHVYLQTNELRNSINH